MRGAGVLGAGCFQQRRMLEAHEGELERHLGSPPGVKLWKGTVRNEAQAHRQEVATGRDHWLVCEETT
jgi:hypothetical protein